MRQTLFIYSLLFLVLILSGCAQKSTMDTVIKTRPAGATITIDGIQQPEVTPFSYKFDFANNQEYTLLVDRDGYFQKEVIVNKNYPLLKKGKILIKLTPSPLWEATTFSPATNNWVQVLVGGELTAKMAWQIMVDAVIKRSANIKELNYEAGYLQTKFTVKKFDTQNGEFLLRCQMIATLVSSEPLIYRIKDVAEWSGNGVQWHPYNRIFIEHANMIEEIQDRLRSN
ncbi:hypothetical protein DGMP_06280 [Desulfomarina profundi]|uniref:PEGA domain-containing protein n=1 Tax=Desulfomarina profundi TaxID=2772557 RepID=A0A8D5FG44_9BACT|nr:hypothetical protein [Desulfomarina profundi]BCL59935.1 hypothetical protein DGMP_06280 [Desulfomarina profundi]